MLIKRFFDIDSTLTDCGEKRLLGYTKKGDYWNGWAKPYLTKESVLRYIEAFGVYEIEMSFDESKDTLKIDENFEFGNHEEIKGEDIETEDGIKHLYWLGDLGYVFDGYETEEEIDE